MTKGGRSRTKPYFEYTSIVELGGLPSRQIKTPHRVEVHEGNPSVDFHRLRLALDEDGPLPPLRAWTRARAAASAYGGGGGGRRVRRGRRA